MKTTKITIATGLIAGAFTISSCTPTQQQYGLAGAAAGAGISAIAGGDGKNIAQAAALGGAGGVGLAAYQDRNNSNNGTFNTGGDTPPPSGVTAPSYPTANPSGVPNIVVSPYKPYNKVNVNGFKPGQLAKDPTTGQIFVVPN